MLYLHRHTRKRESHTFTFRNHTATRTRRNSTYLSVRIDVRLQKRKSVYHRREGELIPTRKRASAGPLSMTMHPQNGATVFSLSFSRGNPPPVHVVREETRGRPANRQAASRSAGAGADIQAARVTDGHIAFRGSISSRFRGCNSRKVVSGPCFAGVAAACVSIPHGPSPSLSLFIVRSSGFSPLLSPPAPATRSPQPSIFFSLDFCPLFQAFLLPACIPLAAER